MRPSRPQIHPQSTVNPPPQQFNSNQFPTGFNPRFPSPQNPNFTNCGPGGPPLPQFVMHQPQPQPNLNQVVAAAALQLLQQQSNPQFPVNQAQNNNLAAALVQMAGMLGGGHSTPGPQLGQFPPLNGNPAPSFQMPHQQQHPGFQRPPTPQHQQSVRPQVYPQNQLMNGNPVRPFQAPRPMQQHQHHATNTMNQQFYPQTNGNQMLQHHPPSSQQQHHHLTSSMHTFNVPPSSQPGISGSPQNSGNPMVLNGASQWNNQGPGQFAAPSSNGPGALQQNPMVPQNSQPLTFPTGDQPPWMNGNGLWRPQVNHASDLSQLAPSVMNKDFVGKVPSYGKGVQSNMRFQNHTSYVKNAKGNMGPSTKNGGQGRQQRKPKKQLNSCEEPKRKYPRITYSEREVSEWREARKKNYPTTDPIIKKSRKRKGGKSARTLTRKWENEEDAKLHRQQLKEILAKQKELEVNICEIPDEYLSEPEKKNNKPRAVSAKRPPTLLQKLLGPEKLRDKSYLLQVFRFMALNNFFDQSPDKPFKFPVVKREGADKDDAEDEDDNDDSDVEGKEKEEDEDEDDEEAVEEHLSSKDSEKVDSDKTEEGEITE